MNYNLRPRKAIVLGGSSGIGFAIAKKLIENDCKVCIASRNKEKLNRAAEQLSSPSVSILEMDITDSDGMVPKFNDAACLLGGYYDCLVNSAGILLGGNNWTITSDNWDKIIDTNLKAAVFAIRCATAQMRDNCIKGNILTIASVNGMNGTNIGTAYDISKNAIVNVIRRMGKDAAHLGIVINGVAPGITYTPMSPHKTIKSSTQGIGRPLEASEIADIACFMLSDEAKICIGETIIADGGAQWTW